MLRQITCLLLACLIYASTQGKSESFEIPFLMIDNLMFVQMEVDGIQGQFIVDTGAPDLILNKKYFEGYHFDQTVVGADINGHVNLSDHIEVKTLILGPWEKRHILARITDLTSTEEAKKVQVHGVLGYRVFRKFEMVFDFERQILTFNKSSKKEEQLSHFAIHNNTPSDSFDLKLNGHFPFISIQIGNQQVKIGIDSGAEINLLHKEIFRHQMHLIQYLEPIRMNGFSNKSRIVQTATLSQLELGKETIKDMNFAIVNMEKLHLPGNVFLDGVLTMNTLSKNRLSINYRTKKIYIWNPTEEPIFTDKTTNPIDSTIFLTAPRFR